VKVIGLTGNIGFGKRTVARMLRDLGVPTIDADGVARRLREEDASVRARILERFGTVDAPRLAELVFIDAAALADLEAILHPAVRVAVAARLAELEATATEACAIEAIKLLESPLRERCDQVWVVRCEEDDALRRLMAGRGMSEAEARARLANQSPQAAKLAAADVVIDGSAPRAGTRRQVADAWAELRDG
jgi:dephospho-CoA kinase